MHRILLIIILLLSVSTLTAQISSGLIFKYDFDDCSNTNSIVKDANGNSMADGLIIGNPGCGPCGINNSGFQFDGSTQILAGEFTKDFPSSNAFTLGFNMQAEDDLGSYEVFSKSDNCGNDSAMLAIYSPSSREFTLFMQETSSKRVELKAVIPNNFCWFHVGITRRTNRVELYINGVKVDEGSTSGSIFIGNHDWYFGGGQCIQNYQPFKGFIDEIELYDDVFTQAEMMDLSKMINDIPLSVYNINLGQSVQVNTNPSCAQDIQWSPTTNVDNPNSFSPNINPRITTTYTAAITDQNTGCVTTDTVLIDVTDPNIFSCRKIVMPTAFRPSSNIGENRTIGITSASAVHELLRFEIFDRKGNLVWQSSQKTAQWDGTFKGELLPPDTYVCKIRYRCDQEILNHTSTVYLLR